MPLEFEGVLPVPAWAGRGLDCRICMILRGADEEAYRVRVDVADTMERISLMPVGMPCIALPDGYYAHANHDAVEKTLYAEMLEARLPKVDYNAIGVMAWLTGQIT